MGREIKFRVYDKEFKKTHIVGTKQHDELTFYDGVVKYYNLQNGEGSGEHGDYILMQYTGLKDKNGKEIYEGDILKCKCTKHKSDDGFLFHSESYTIHQNSVIEWWESFTNIGYRLRNGRGKTMMVKPSSLNKMEVGVIGNLYENPELLEVKEGSQHEKTID